MFQGREHQRWLGVVALVLMATGSVRAQGDVIVDAEVVEAVVERDGDVVLLDAAQNRKPGDEKKLLKEALEPVLKAELYFLFMVTKADEDAKDRVVASAEKELESMDEILLDQRFANGVVLAVSGPTVVAQTSNGVSLNANPYTRIREKLLVIAEQELEPAQAEKYKSEIAKRGEFRRQAMVGMVVNLLDQHLALSVEQRDQITENLMEKWPGAVNMSVENYLNNSNYVPVLPFPLIDTVLNRDQRTVWKTLNQYHFPMQVSNDQIPLEWDF